MIKTASVSLATKEYQAYVGNLQEAKPELARDFAGFTGINHVLDWMKTHKEGRWNLDMVGQDEFHYDFLIELAPDGEWLSFGVT